MSLLNEKSLILDLQKGSISVFEKVFSIYHKRIYNFCISLYQSPEDARETVQKVFVALWEQRLKVDENKPITCYLYSIARYMVYQEFRRQVYKKAAFDYLILNSSDFNNTTKDDVLYNELASFLESAIERLPDRQREIFKLNRFTGLTYRQIAEQLDITENTVDTQIRRALEFIRNRYKAYYGSRPFIGIPYS
jgi:RNA polymerase sigma-70 factor, ECF subfamily